MVFRVRRETASTWAPTNGTMAARTRTEAPQGRAMESLMAAPPLTVVQLRGSPAKQGRQAPATAAVRLWVPLRAAPGSRRPRTEAKTRLEQLAVAAALPATWRRHEVKWRCSWLG